MDWMNHRFKCLGIGGMITQKSSIPSRRLENDSLVMMLTKKRVTTVLVSFLMDINNMLTSDIGCPNYVNRIQLISISISKRFQVNYKIHDGYAYDGFYSQDNYKVKN